MQSQTEAAEEKRDNSVMVIRERAFTIVDYILAFEALISAAGFTTGHGFVTVRLGEVEYTAEDA